MSDLEKKKKHEATGLYGGRQKKNQLLKFDLNFACDNNMAFFFFLIYFTQF